jgi:hypothetical protein
MRSTSVFFLGFLAFAIATACGGASNTDLGTGGGGNGSGSGSGSGSGGGSGSSSGAEPDASMQDVTSVDVVQPMETGPIGPAVVCPLDDAGTCSPGDFCCVSGDPTLGTETDTCTHQGQTCAGTPVRCASSADCPKNQVCCGQKDSTGNKYQEVACRQTCTATGQVTFCDPAAATTDCTNPATPNCVQSQLLQGYNVCGP